MTLTPSLQGTLTQSTDEVGFTSTSWSSNNDGHAISVCSSLHIALLYRQKVFHEWYQFLVPLLML